MSSLIFIITNLFKKRSVYSQVKKYIQRKSSFLYQKVKIRWSQHKTLVSKQHLIIISLTTVGINLSNRATSHCYCILEYQWYCKDKLFFAYNETLFIHWEYILMRCLICVFSSAQYSASLKNNKIKYGLKT